MHILRAVRAFRRVNRRISSPNLHHRPFRDLRQCGGGIVIDHTTRTVDDLLVALDLGDDLLLHLQRRQRDLDAFAKLGL